MINHLEKEHRIFVDWATQPNGQRERAELTPEQQTRRAVALHDRIHRRSNDHDHSHD